MNTTTTQDNPASQFVAVAAFAATLASAKNARAFSARGKLRHDGNGLDVASMSGDVLFGPVIDQAEPIAFAGDLAVDRDASTAVFSFAGSAIKRTGAFTFDVRTGNLWSGMVVHESGDAGVVDVLSGYEFTLKIDQASGVGTFAYLDAEQQAQGVKRGTIGTVKITRTESGGARLELAGVVYGPECEPSTQREAEVALVTRETSIRQGAGRRNQRPAATNVPIAISA